MIFRTSLYFHENTFVVLIYQNTYEYRQKSVINYDKCCHDNAYSMVTL